MIVDRVAGARLRLAAAVAALTLLVAIPFLRLLQEALGSATSLGGVWSALGEPLRNTVISATGSALVAVAIGLAGAILVERAGGRAWLHAAMLLPLVIPPFVSAVGWLRAFGQSGLADDVTGIAWSGLEGGLGVSIVIAVNAAPIAYLIIWAAVRARLRGGQIDAARTAGASWLTAVRTVGLPLLRPALVGAFGIVFVFGVNSFGVPAVLGTPAGFDTVTTSIFQDLVRSASDAAFDRVLWSSLLLVVMAIVVVAVTDGLGAWRGGTVGLSARRPARSGRWGSVVLAGYALVTSGLPVVALLLSAVTRAPGLAPVPENLTMANFRMALAGSGIEAFGRSLALAAAAALIVVGLGGLSASLRSIRGGRAAGTATVVTFAVPGSALAVAMLLAYGRPLGDGVALILAAYVAKFWALAHRTIDGTAAGIATGPVDAARVSGATRAVAVRTILVPLLMPALASAWIIVFLFGFHELTMSSLLYGPGSETLAVVILNLQQLGDPGPTAALATVLIGVVFAIALLGYSLQRRAAA